jgi:hypothetical protein
MDTYATVAMQSRQTFKMGTYHFHSTIKLRTFMKWGRQMCVCVDISWWQFW